MKPVFRDWIEAQIRSGHMKKISREVNPEYELAAVGKKLDPSHGAFFENVKGSSMPVVAGVITSGEDMARALNLSYSELMERYVDALSNLTPCKVLNKEDGPFAVKDNILVGDQVDLGFLPACLNHIKDSGRFLTAAVCITKDPDTGIRNMCIHRHEIQGKNRLGAYLLPRHTNQIFSKCEAQGKPLEVALAIGVHPAILLSSQATTRLGVDELEIAGTLLGEPVELVKCETVDLEVPVESEIVIEGRILPNIRADEGPFGEYPRTYGPKAPRNVIEVTAITYRNNPIYHTIIPATSEHLLLGGIAREATMLQLVRQVTPNVKQVHLTPASGCRYHAVIQIDPKHEGEAKNAMFAAFSSSTEVKHVVAVNSDVDPRDPRDVEWAIACRVQATKDIFMIPSAMGNKLDPSAKNGVCDKMGIDATIPVGADLARYEKARIQGIDTICLEEYLEK